MDTLEHLVMKTRQAAQGGFDSLSTGEKLAAALVLNRPDWLHSMNYTIAEAIDRIDTEWVQLIPAAAKAITNSDVALRQMDQIAKAESFLSSQGADDDVIDLNASLVTSGEAPGYRDVMFTFEVQRIGVTSAKRQICLRLNPKDGETIMNRIKEVHSFAWRAGNVPIDAQPGEQRPRWVD